MLIVCTKDPTIVDFTKSSESGSKQWGELVILTGNQTEATIQLIEALKRVNDPLCLSAHGSDTEIGDEGYGGKYWTWTAKQIAAHFLDATGSYGGPILIHACAKNVSNFSAHLAVALEEVGALNNVWIYGYNKAIGSDARYPDPAFLNLQVDLQFSKVGSSKTY